MAEKSNSELVHMVQQLIDADLTEQEEERIIDDLKSSVLHPRITDLIYYNIPKLTAGEVVEKALAYRSVEL